MGAAHTEPHGARMDYHLERKLETFEHKINEQVARKMDVLLRENQEQRELNQKQQELIDSLQRQIQGSSDTNAVRRCSHTACTACFG